MNIIHLMIKEIKQNIRDKKAMAMMILFPILLILVLGNALKDSNYYGDSLAKSKVLYNIQSTGTAAKDFKENIIDKGKDLNIDFTETKDIEAAKKLIKNRNEYDSLIIMKDDTIDVYKNSRYDLLSGLSESILDTYVQRYNTIAQISKINPSKLNEILSDTNTHYTSIVSIDKGRTPSSLDYYTITMITLIIMYGVSISLYGIAGERIIKTRDRILNAPVKKYEFLIGKTLGFVCIMIIQMAVVILFTKYILHSYWGNNMPPVLLIILSQIIMVVGLGMSFGFMFKNENTANGILNVVIPVFEFLGGGYFSVDNINSSDMTKVLPALIANLSIAAICIAAASIKFRKETAI